MTWLEELMKVHTGEEGVLDVGNFKKALKEAYKKNAVDKGDFDVKAAELETANASIKDLKGGNVNNETLQGKITEYETQIGVLRGELSGIKLSSAIERGLLGAKARNVKATCGLLDMEKLELLEDGSLKGLEDQIKALKEGADTGFLFEESKGDLGKGAKKSRSVYKPQAGENHKESYGAQMAAEHNAAAASSTTQSLWEQYRRKACIIKQIV